MNRLKLNFDLIYSDERADFLQNYLCHEMFIAQPPTEAELETMGNYVLWGKNRQTGLNAKQDGSVPLTSKTRDWDEARKCTSLEALLESPSFSETQFAVNRPPLKAPQMRFSRSETRAACPPTMLPLFEQLWHDIDDVDLRVSLYAVAHEKQKSPVRPALLAKYTPEQVAAAQAEIDAWDTYRYLRARHQLIDLRRQQYTLRDCYAPSRPNIDTMGPTTPPVPISFGDEVVVLPLGLGPYTTHTPPEATLVFKDFEDLQAQQFAETDLRAISKFYWGKQRWQPGAQQMWFDFREPSHIYALCMAWLDLRDNGDAETASYEWMTQALLGTLEYYAKQAQLTDVQRDVWDMKIRKASNSDVATAVNTKHGTHYQPNYISTIFCQKIIPRIADAARLHATIVENLPFDEEFKTCSVCGRRLLLHEANFVRRQHSRTGFAGRCKCCDKKAR